MIAEYNEVRYEIQASPIKNIFEVRNLENKNTYEVDIERSSCTCPHFIYRGVKCKHIEMVRAYVEKLMKSDEIPIEDYYLLNKKTQRIPLKKAEKLAEEIVKLLKPYCHKIEVVGSIRRKKPEVKDIEVLVIPKTSFENTVKELIKKGIVKYRPTKSADKVEGEKVKLLKYKNINLDVFTADEKNWYSLLFLRTGSAENNIRIFTILKRKGYKVNLYDGVIISPEGKKIPVRDEKIFYDLAGVEYLPPERR